MLAAPDRSPRQRLASHGDQGSTGASSSNSGGPLRVARGVIRAAWQRGHLLWHGSRPPAGSGRLRV